MDLTSPWIWYISLLALTVAIFYSVFKTLLTVSLASSRSVKAVSIVFFLLRYGWPSVFFCYLVLFTKNGELTGGYLSFQLAIIFCSLAIDFMRYGYQRAKQKEASVKQLHKRLKVVEAKLNSLEYRG